MAARTSLHGGGDVAESSSSSSSPFRLYDLPTELVELVYSSFESPPPFDDDERRQKAAAEQQQDERERLATLSSLCLVDRASHVLARRILYSTIKLGVGFMDGEGDSDNVRVSRLARTLRGRQQTETKIERLEIEFTCPSQKALEALYCVLERCEVTRAVTTRWIFGGGGWLANEVRDTIKDKQPGLKVFDEVPSVLGFESASW